MCPTDKPSNRPGFERPSPDATSAEANTPPAADAQSVVDRRTIPDRRALIAKMGSRLMGAVPPDEAPGLFRTSVPSAATGLERRRGPGRRLSDFQRAAEEGELTTEQFFFLIAIDEFKKANGKTFPSWTDVLEVVRLLGYRKTRSSELNLLRAEDWTEPADAPAQVRPARWHERFMAPPQRDAA
ncbi:MAG: hypothetical protein KF787_04865 [Phycisphaeraceae bacterium]|nr:hypothetical protein [Phycisphaerae bacterium]MBX3391961.1 hypothetical protein [Phycisphaeraceae bacterium]HRJ49893.1 hypothetical protein [Phycisphaerales bacterium]